MLTLGLVQHDDALATHPQAPLGGVPAPPHPPRLALAGSA